MKVVFSYFVLAAAAVLAVTAGCGSSTPSVTCSAGDTCSFGDASVGICAGSVGCVEACPGFEASCSLTGTACYPVFHEKFGCLALGTPLRLLGESCVNQNDCEPDLACVSKVCMQGCSDTIACPMGGGPCEDVSGYGWKVCNLKTDGGM